MNREAQLREDFGFVPCRDEHCEQEDLHPAHRVRGRGKFDKGRICWVCVECRRINPSRTQVCLDCGWEKVK